jgi:hypothetical protein
MVGHPALEIGSPAGTQCRNHPGLGGAGLRVSGEDDQPFTTTCRHNFFPVAAIETEGPAQIGTEFARGLSASEGRTSLSQFMAIAYNL